MAIFNSLIDQDTRFWEVFDENGTSLGLFMYGDLIIQFAHGQGVLGTALEALKGKSYTWKIVGDVCPIHEDSDNPIIQEKKIKFRQREKEKAKKRAKKHGFKLQSSIRFGKHSGTKVKDIIDKHPSYWNWIIANQVLLLHPEVKHYTDSLNK